MKGFNILSVSVERRKSLVSRSPEKELFKIQHNVQLSTFSCFTLSTKPVSMVGGKHTPAWGVTGNETNENNHEKPNGVSNLIEFSVTCDL